MSQVSWILPLRYNDDDTNSNDKNFLIKLCNSTE